MSWDGLPSKEQYAEEVTNLLCALIRFDTTNPPGNETPCAEFLRQRFEAEGIEAQVVESAPGRGNVIARLPGEGGGKSMLLLSHLDVVPVQEPAEWTAEPFAGVVRDGFVWGRGALDCKCLTAMEAVAMFVLKRAGVRLKGDLLFAAVADEEVGGDYGAAWLVSERPEALRADYCINEGGGFSVTVGRGKNLYAIDVAEKGVLWLRLRFKGRPGHGSMPRAADNALVKLSEAVEKVHRYVPRKVVMPVVRQFITGVLVAQRGARGRVLAPLLLDSPLSGFLLRQAARQQDRAGQIDAMLRLTISPNVAAAGGKTNIIPGAAELTLDCRLLPGQTKETVYQELRRAGLDLSSVEVEELEWAEPSWSPTDNEFFRAIEDALHELEPGVPVLPMLVPGMSDSRFARQLGGIAYGFQPTAPEEDGAELGKRAHGIDERIGVASLSFGTDAILRVVLKTIGA
jgi:acetylornithine deacetylase/succinyl-diaminopimelate desuccinylase-like protein